ncbi:hypothetical protein AMJ57_04760 [Parcubacteria bacterium SG8_24]|nr:MAG: hypothetical protein AMJ57_04760 [Parcubacteria bacterium SG8_24]
MKIQSPAFAAGSAIPSEHTCDGEDVSPPLFIDDLPEGTESLVLVVDDPDAPMGTWVHWTVWNISPEVGEVAEGEVPAEGIEGITSFGRAGYGGPCPPSGEHRYFFRLYALDTLLDLAGSADIGELEAAMEGHVLDSAETMGVYSRGQ